MPEYSFDRDLACKIGVDEAIMVKNFQFWIEKNRANNKHFYDGRYWTYNSVKAFKDLFPFWTDKQLRRIIESLVNQKIIMRGNYNKSNIDRTGWYTFVKQEAFLGIYDLPERAIPFAQTGEAIPDSKTYSKQQTAEVEDILSSDLFGDSDVKTKKEKLPPTPYKICLDYFIKEKHPKWIVTAVMGKSLKEILSKIKKSIIAETGEVNDEQIVDLFKIIFDNLPEWYKEKDLQTINSKYNEITTEIKNRNDGITSTKGKSKSKYSPI